MALSSRERKLPPGIDTKTFDADGAAFTESPKSLGFNRTMCRVIYMEGMCVD